MRQSLLFSKIEKHDPKDEAARNARLLIRGGFIAKVMAGVYDYLPLGLRVVKKITAIVREEMNALGAEELSLSVLQDKQHWMHTGRWDLAKEVMYQFTDARGKEIGLGWTNEEPITALAKRFISSYKDLPRAVYQIQLKFRNEPRAKSGLLRGREFTMKDLYSFHADSNDLDRFYEQVAVAYEKIFRRVGLQARRTIASGGLFSEFSDEFQVLADVGEDTVYACTSCPYTVNKEVAAKLKIASQCKKCGGKVEEKRSIEVGNIFKLGTKYAEAFDLMYRRRDGTAAPVVMASYGIGIGRLMGTLVEVFHDQHGIIWPASVAPYQVHLLNFGGGDAEKVYRALLQEKVEVLYDDREGVSQGQKLVEADLLGIPIRAIVGGKTKDKIEVKKRSDSDVAYRTLKQFLAELRK
ncbi:hypothetical protein D6779_07710 [Candidatus Parcubacteria bacterium]|nr:MAG: hypothetical protein D6779_07710 [Candidatus Parcubacteria bacterium]